MSVTVPRLIRLPFVSETLTTARTTADLSLSLSSVSILACDTGAEYTWLILEPDGLRSGAWISSSFARGSDEGGAAPVKMLFRPLSLFLVALYRFAPLLYWVFAGGLTEGYDGVGCLTDWACGFGGAL